MKKPNIQKVIRGIFDFHFFLNNVEYNTPGVLSVKNLIGLKVGLIPELS